MKPLYSILAAVMLLGPAVPLARAGVQVSVDFFHDNLESYGDWREVGDYGYCWQPRDVDRDWRPYSDGHWVYTDAGWTWDSEEPYSWAVYHYGRWARVDRIGWVWVPGTEWGPAWVSWRRSPQHVGWAPLPPEARFSRSAGFSSRVDADYDIGPTNYSFVEVRNFGAPRLRTVIVEPRENITIIHQTTNITRITYVNNVVYNEGPQYDVISRESAQPIRRLKLERREELDGDPRTVRAEQLRATVAGDSFRVVAPAFDTKPATAPRKVAAKVEKAEVDHGWKNAGPPAEVAKLRTKIKSEPAAPAEPSLEPKAAKTAEAPAAAETNAVPLSASPANAKAKAKGKNAPAARSAAAPAVPEAAPASVPAVDTAKPEKTLSEEKPVVSDQPTKAGKPGKLGKVAKPVNPEANPPAAPTAATPEQPQVRKGKNKTIEAARPPAEAPPQAQAPIRKKESAEPSGELPPAAGAKARQKGRPEKGDAPPNPEQPAARSIERSVPNQPEPRPQAKRPEARPQAAPVVTQPRPAAAAQPAKGKGKGKDDKKDEAKPEGAPQ
ncbi:MAG: hypothetical protein QOE70_1262 [Chthoniobacter sp.]|jgi:hypothetical protein|nr:hypothetical protein [Chthoniobacter sp.]